MFEMKSVEQKELSRLRKRWGRTAPLTVRPKSTAAVQPDRFSLPRLLTSSSTIPTDWPLPTSVGSVIGGGQRTPIRTRPAAGRCGALPRAPPDDYLPGDTSRRIALSFLSLIQLKLPPAPRPRHWTAPSLPPRQVTSLRPPCLQLTALLEASSLPPLSVQLAASVLGLTTARPSSSSCRGTR